MYYQYFVVTNGKTIEDVVRESLENGTKKSNAKVRLEDWYAANLYNTIYETQIEDTVYCNDRSIYSLGGMNPNGGTLTRKTSTQVLYSTYNRSAVTFNPSIKCSRPQDAFTKEIANGNGLLDYSVGLITSDEIMLAGGKYATANANFYLKTGTYYWSMSPAFLRFYGDAIGFHVDSTTSYSAVTSNANYGLRPVLSIKNGITIVDNDADGTVSKPYVIK